MPESRTVTLYAVRAGSERVVDSRQARETLKRYTLGAEMKERFGLLHGYVLSRARIISKKDFAAFDGCGLTPEEAIRSHVASERAYVQQCRRSLNEAQASFALALELAEEVAPDA